VVVENNKQANEATSALILAPFQL